MQKRLAIYENKSTKVSLITSVRPLLPTQNRLDVEKHQVKVLKYYRRKTKLIRRPSHASY